MSTFIRLRVTKHGKPGLWHILADDGGSVRCITLSHRNRAELAARGENVETTTERPEGRKAVCWECDHAYRRDPAVYWGRVQADRQEKTLARVIGRSRR